MKERFFKRISWKTLVLIFALAGPTILEQLMQTAVQYIDTAMVGSLGTQATAAVGSTSTVNWLISSTIHALSVGFLTYIARACGAGDAQKAKRISSQATIVVLAAGVFSTVLTLSLSRFVPVWMQADPDIRDVASQYFFAVYAAMLPRTAQIIYGTLLRAAGDTKSPMRVGFLINVINVILNILLIFPTRMIDVFGASLRMPGAGLGVIGAAIASSVSYTIGGIVMTAIVWKHPVISPRGMTLKPDRNVLLPCLKVTLPNMLQRFITSLGYVFFATMINALGETATAAHTIANTVESAFYIPGYGMQTAAATLTGNALGAKDRQKMKDVTRMLILIEVVLMVISGGLLFAFAPAMVSVFSKSTAVIIAGAAVLRMVALSEPFYGVAVIIEGVLQGVGQTMIPFLFSISTMWLIRIIGTFIATSFFNGDLITAWQCMIGHNMVLFSLLLFYYRRGKWNPLEKA